MALYKRNKVYWIDIAHNGARIQRSTRTSDKIAARQLHDKIKAELWQQSNLNKKPKKTWMEAAMKWLDESSHKRSLVDDKYHLRWLDPYLRNVMLEKIDRPLINEISVAKLNAGVTNATVNRMLALIRAILNKAVDEWEWLEYVPKIKLLKEDKHRIRWLTQAEATRLLTELPKHLSDMVMFTLATGLRQANVKNLKWENIDLSKQHLWVHSDESKSNVALAIPLNQDAMIVLNKRLGEHPIYVFTYGNQCIKQVNTKAWHKALNRAGITNFRWHDLRHTWASWHVQNGTSLQELQQLGGWLNFNMVLRYAHLSSNHLRDAAQRIHVTNSLHSAKSVSN